MTGFRNFVMSCALGVATLMTPAAPVLAMPQAVPSAAINAGSDVQQVDHRRWHRRHHYNRHHRRHYGHRRHYRPGFGVYIAPRPIYRERYVRRGSAHVNWCLGRYRSYNPATNRFLSYGGAYKVCHSPYR